jgi:hypothetical protein
MDDYRTNTNWQADRSAGSAVGDAIHIHMHESISHHRSITIVQVRWQTRIAFLMSLLAVMLGAVAVCTCTWMHVFIHVLC